MTLKEELEQIEITRRMAQLRHRFDIEERLFLQCLNNAYGIEDSMYLAKAGADLPTRPHRIPSKKR